MKLRYIFIPFLLVLLMSHNSFATTANIVPQNVYVHRVSRSDMTTNSYETYTFQYTNSTYGYKWAGIGKAWSIMSMKFPLGRTIEANSYFSMSFTCLNCSFGNVSGLGDTKIDSVSFVQGTTGGGSIFVTGHFTNDVTQLSIGDDNNIGNVFLYGVVNQDFNIFQPKINIFDYQDQAAEQINQWKEQEETSINNIQNQNSSDVGGSENAGTTNLIGALGGFITTIANAPATNCNITGDFGNLNVGAINLCQGKENFNTLVEFIGFTALFGVVFWAGYHLVKRTLSLIDWARSK